MKPPLLDPKEISRRAIAAGLLIPPPPPPAHRTPPFIPYEKRRDAAYRGHDARTARLLRSA